MNNGAFGENFPYSNFHDLNMDWIIKIAKDFLDQYTHIQEIISEGEESILDKTESGLTQLQEKADNLSQLLQDWYDTHSNDIANQLASALQDLNDWYTEHQNFLNSYLINAINTFESAADAKATETLESIPEDYTELSNAVQGLTSDNGIEPTWIMDDGVDTENEDAVYTNNSYAYYTSTAWALSERLGGCVLRIAVDDFDVLKVPKFAWDTTYTNCIILLNSDSPSATSGTNLIRGYNYANYTGASFLNEQDDCIIIDKDKLIESFPACTYLLMNISSSEQHCYNYEEIEPIELKWLKVNPIQIFNEKGTTSPNSNAVFTDNSYIYFASNNWALTSAQDICILRIAVHDFVKIKVPKFYFDQTYTNVLVLMNQLCPPPTTSGIGQLVAGFTYSNYKTKEFITEEDNYIVIDKKKLVTEYPACVYIGMNIPSASQYCYNYDEIPDIIFKWLKVSEDNLTTELYNKVIKDYSIFKNSYIKNKVLTRNQASYKACYNGIDLGEGNKSHKITATGRFQSGNTGSDAILTLIANPNGTHRISDVTTKSIHACFLSNSWHFDLWNNGAQAEVLAYGTYTDVGTDEITVAIEQIDSTTYRIYLPDNTTQDVTYSDGYDDYNGRYVMFEQYTNKTTPAEQHFFEMKYVSVSKNTQTLPCFYDDFNRFDGSPMTSPLGYTWTQINGSDGTDYND